MSRKKEFVAGAMGIMFVTIILSINSMVDSVSVV
jgi:hypothetical protein